MDILAITKPFSLKLLRKVLSKMLRRKRKAFSEKKNMTGSISDKEQREIGREVHRENSFLKVPTPVFVILGVILFVIGMLLVILIWTPLNLWKIGLGANSKIKPFSFGKRKAFSEKKKLTRKAWL